MSRSLHKPGSHRCPYSQTEANIHGHAYVPMNTYGVKFSYQKYEDISERSHVL